MTELSISDLAERIKWLEIEKTEIDDHLSVFKKSIRNSIADYLNDSGFKDLSTSDLHKFKICEWIEDSPTSIYNKFVQWNTNANTTHSVVLIIEGSLLYCNMVLLSDIREKFLCCFKIGEEREYIRKYLGGDGIFYTDPNFMEILDKSIDIIRSRFIK